MFELLGCWELDPNDVRAFAIYGSVSIEFKSGGELMYTVHSIEKDEVAIMTYEVKGSLLVTDQLSAPHKEETAFRILSDNRLELFFGGIKSVYIRK